MSKKTHRDATKFVGTRQYIDQQTGEIVDAEVIVRSTGDTNFKKIWLGHILEAVEELGNAKMRVLFWMMNAADSNNRIFGTYDSISAETGVGRATVGRLLASLQAANIVKKEYGSVWTLNPNVVFKGGHNKRMDVLIRYRETSQMELELAPDKPSKQAKPKAAA